MAFFLPRTHFFFKTTSYSFFYCLTGNPYDYYSFKGGGFLGCFSLCHQPPGKALLKNKQTNLFLLLICVCIPLLLMRSNHFYDKV